MPRPRAAPLGPDTDPQRDREARHAEIMQALGMLATVIAAPQAKAAVPANDQDDKCTLRAAQLGRITDELNAVRAASAEATQKILDAAEEIDQLANTLSAALKGKLEQDLAQDVTDLIIRIFEACNFQDLIGQRVTKVTAMLDGIENEAEPPALMPSSAPEIPGDFCTALDSPTTRATWTRAKSSALFGD